MRIAIYQHDPSAAERIAQLLSAAGHGIYLQNSRYDLVSLLDRSTMDLVVTEWHGMVIADGISSHWLIREARKTAVLFTTAELDAPDLSNLISSNAIDFIMDTPSDDQLIERVNAILHRAYPNLMGLPSFLEVGPYLLDSLQRTIRYEGSQLERLSERLFKLAYCLLANVNRPLSRDYLKEFVGGSVEKSNSRYLDNTVGTLKSLLKLDGNNPLSLRSIYGFGYVLEIIERSPIAAQGKSSVCGPPSSSEPIDTRHGPRS